MKKLIGVLTCTLLVLFFACRKDVKNGETYTVDVNTFSVSDAKHYFYNTVRKLPDPSSQVNNLSVMSAEHGKNSLYGTHNKIYPYWKYAYSSTNKYYHFIELPYTSKNKFSTIIKINDANPTPTSQSLPILGASLNRMIIYKNHWGKINQRLVTYIPTASYAAAHHNDISNNHIDKLDQDFDGFLEYKDANGKFLYALQIKDGKAIKRYRGQNTKPLPKAAMGKTKLSINTVECEIPYVEHWEQDCTQIDDPDNPGTPITDICTDWYLASVDYGDPICTDDDPCSDPANFDSAECGGSGGPDIVPPEPDPNDRDCIGNISGDIANEIAQMTPLLNAFSGSGSYAAVANMLSQVQSNPAYKTAITEEVIPDQVNENTNQTEQTDGHTDAVPALGEELITLNSTYLDAASDLSVARTIIHEEMHAYFEWEMNIISSNGVGATLSADQQSFVDANNLLYNKKGLPLPGVEQGNAQHEEMATRYVDGLAATLVTYANAHNITSPDPTLSLYDYCHDLAWGGLQGTAAYYHVPSATRNRIDTHIKNESTNNASSTKVKSC